MDGTFKVAPNAVQQVYSIHNKLHSDILSRVYCVMTLKNQVSYELLFQAVKNGLPEGRRNGPAQFSLDCEHAAVDVFVAVSPNAITSILLRRFVEKRRKVHCRNCTIRRRTGHCEQASSYPWIAIRADSGCHRGKTSLLNRLDDEPLDNVLDLLEDYYVLGRRRGRGRRPPMSRCRLKRIVWAHICYRNEFFYENNI